MQTHEIALTRAQLYELVWTRPIWQLAKEYGLSDVGLAKICKRARIPTPPRGHWAKVRQGRKVQPEPLPDALEMTGPILRAQLHSPSRKASKETTPAPNVPLQTDLSQVHPLVKRTAMRFARFGVDRAEVISFHDPQLLAIEASPKESSRAVLLMSSLIEALETRGHCVELEPGKDKHSVARTIFVIGGERLRVSLKEERIREQLPEPARPKSPYDYSRPAYRELPSGRLRFRIEELRAENVRRTWADGRIPLERRLPVVVLGLEAAATAERAERLEREERHRRWEEERIAAEKERERLAIEKWRVEQLHKLVADWTASRRIRGFARALEISGNATEEQLAWIRDVASRTNPLPLVSSHAIWRDDPYARFR